MQPALYHAHHSRYTDDLPFWLDLASRLGGPILELGCGSGRVLVPLAQSRHVVFGLDHDLGMLRFLRQQIPLDVFQADLAAFHLHRSFALILVPCNTWSILTPTIRLRSLSCILRHLRPGGCFAASLPNPALLAALPRRAEPEIEEEFTHPETGNPVQVSSAWRRDRQFFTVTWYYDHLLPDGQVQRVSSETRHLLIQLPEYLDEFTAAGFQTVTIYGDYDRSPYAEDSPYAILIAQL